MKKPVDPGHGAPMDARLAYWDAFYAWDAEQKAKRAYRTFPGPPHDPGGNGSCRWCGKSILKPGGILLDRRRSWHPACLDEYYLHTSANVQARHLVERDGPGCKSCGHLVGGWHRGIEITSARLADWGEQWVARYPVDPFWGDFTRTWWVPSLQVDHVKALALVAHLPPEERRAYFHPDNLQLLCDPCHKVKTVNDRRAIAEQKRNQPCLNQ